MTLHRFLLPCAWAWLAAAALNVGAMAQEPAASAAQPAASAPSAPGPSTAEQLKREIDMLRGLIDGRLPQDTALPALFEIDLENEAAVSQRVQTLSERLAAEAPTAPAAPGAEGEVAALRTARDTFRLAFLRLPPNRRDALREQDRLKRQSEALAAEKQRSVAAMAATEEARDSALAAASQATDNSARVLANEEARLLAHLSELSALRQSWVERKQVQLKKYGELLALFGAVGSPPRWTAQEAAARYAELREVLSQLREQADRALTALDARSALVPLRAGPALDTASYATNSDAVRRVRELRTKISIEESALAARETEARYAEAEDVMNTLRTLQARRIAMLQQLSTARRNEVAGFSREGLERVLSEVSYVRLMARWYPVRRAHDVKDVSSLLQGSLALGRYGASAFVVLLTLISIVVVLRRGRGWLVALRIGPVAHLKSPAMRRTLDALLQMMLRTWREVILLLTLYLVFDLWLVGHAGMPELDTLRSLAYAYAWYRLALAFIHRVLLVTVSRYHTVPYELNQKILWSLRLVARVALMFVAYLILAQALLGRGALYGIAREVAVAGAFLVGWRLIRGWRGEVTHAYLSLFPQGRLADRVRASQSRSHGLLIAAAAFVFVAARGVGIWLRDTALRFEQTRKALAYLFRRQLERQSKNQPAPPDPTQLPAELQTALTEEAVEGDLAIDVYPDLDEVLSLALKLPGGGGGALIALTGERGSGKTSWLQALRARLGAEVPCAMYSFETRDPSAEAVCLALCRLLEVEATTDPSVLAERLKQLPPRVVLLDLVQNVMLRSVGGLAGHQTLIRIAEATVGNMLWVLAYAHWPFEYLQRTQPGCDVYDRVVALRPWRESQISALIDARMAAAGFTADYEQLLFNPSLPTRATQLQANDTAEELERSADRYHRLVWDYADGNPRTALHFFRLSLVWKQGTQVLVRLFPTPPADAFESFEIRTWFTLACLVQHENITVPEAAASLRFELADCARALQLLHSHGFLTCTDDGRYRVASHWVRAVQRFLQRKRMLVV